MASFKEIAFLFLLLQATFLINHQVKSDDEEDNLLQGINKYRASLNLTALVKNENAACFAGQIADQFKGQPCTNTTGSNTIPGTEPQFPNYPDLLAHCHLNMSNTQDAAVMPACVPKLDPSLVLTNFTQSQYSGSLNDTKYTGIGIESEGDWIVVVLSTNSSSSSFEDATGAGSIFSPNLLVYLVAVFMGYFLS
ncbi:putative GPI-anchored protein At3g06035 [Silene latifolia]|uniref:putative GPI-anchored protein At3g06035 n=1 Tax=Silene latifolia TaxID=37657 RepID=UPI003D78474A